MDRRHFIAGMGAALSCATGAGRAFAAAPDPATGIQLWTVARMLAADLEGTIAMLASLGYRAVETYGPYAFSDERNQASWRAVTPSLGFSGSGFFGRTAPQMAQVLRAAGMSAPSMHTDIFTLQTNMGALADAAHALGATYVTLPSLPAPMRTGMDDYKRAADLFNAIGRSASAHGLRFAYHNHGYGLVPVNGVVPLDTLLGATDPAHVFFEMDTYWTVAGGADPLAMLARYKGRYRMMHLKDMKGVHRFSGDGGASTQWIELFPHMTWLGNGTMDIKGIIAAGRAAGVEHFFVEQDRADDVMAAIKGSAAYLKTLGFA